MGEVYRAHDPKLKRDVAIKIIRSDLTGDPERHARFAREARILAALAHPNIATVYGLEDAGSRPALVMELVDGPTLADRINQGPIPLDDALRLASQIAEAVEYAHERGIVHRDLKPANVKLTSDGAIKILDFGLAKALTPDASTDASADTTTGAGGLTEIGTILGTPAYMSPEQATGRPTDRRADVWAFGCVLYEMLTGVRPFVGKGTTDTLAAVLGREPDWSRLPARTPPDVCTILQRCLRKDLRQRLQAIGDARVALGEALTGTSSAPAIAPRPTTSRIPRLAWETTGAVVLVAVTALAAWQLKPVAVSGLAARAFTISLPAGQRLAALDRGTLAFTADGSRLAYVAADATGQRIYLRAMDTAVTESVAGTNGATTPFFSPDGQWLGFFADGRLKKVPLEGGGVTTLTDVPSAFGAAWPVRHTIVFASLWSVLEQIGDGGGAPRDLTGFAGTENIHAWPRAVPGREAVLFATGRPESQTIAVADLAGGDHRDLVSGRGVSSPSYVESGHLLYLAGREPDGDADRP